GRTATLEPEELDDEYFMLRVRIDGGAVTTQQLSVLGEISQTYARDTADITDRQNIQYHWIRIEDMPVIWQKLEGAGMTTMEACGDSPRVILGSPVAGIAKDEVIDGTPAIDAIKNTYIGDKAFSNLPRKFKTAISGLQDVAHEIHDVAFVGVVHPEHGPGFDVWVGGTGRQMVVLFPRGRLWDRHYAVPARGRIVRTTPSRVVTPTTTRRGQRSRRSHGVYMGVALVSGLVCVITTFGTVISQ
ncbi:hypothetical protein ACFQ1S_37375, partial [Kibdelosporangium lantanae]